MSGNYPLQVFREDSPDDVILQALSSAAENLAGISANVTRQTDRGVNAGVAAGEFEADLSGPTGINPYQAPYSDRRVKQQGAKPCAPLRIPNA